MKIIKRFVVGLLVLPVYLVLSLLFICVAVLAIPICLIGMPLDWIYNLGKDIVG
jgi:hypothetical protein